MVMLIVQVSFVTVLLDKLMNMISHSRDMTQSCYMYTSLIEGYKLKFSLKSPESPADSGLYDPKIFITIQFTTIITARFLFMFLPLSITLFIMYRMEMAQRYRRVSSKTFDRRKLF